MSDLANLFPAFVGLFIGIVALVSAHVATRRLKSHQADRKTAASRRA